MYNDHMALGRFFSEELFTLQCSQRNSGTFYILYPNSFDRSRCHLLIKILNFSIFVFFFFVN